MGDLVSKNSIDRLERFHSLLAGQYWTSTDSIPEEGIVAGIHCSLRLCVALLQIVGGDKLIIPFADGAAHEPIQRPAFSA
uniref:hypothetical protein n=1 Tax=Salmonella enterica TaxID=28901 RepID=UPI00155DB90E|nr:hypothetical protein [Salmonella enterica]